MSNFASYLCQKCCPWLWPKTSPLSQFHSKIADNQRQSFMKETFEVPSQLAEVSKEAKIKLQDNMYSEVSTKPEFQVSETKDETPSLFSQGVGASSQDYTECIDSGHPYYQIIRQKLLTLPTIFEKYGEPEKKVPETPYGLQLYIRQTEDEKSNIFVYHFTFPTTFELYEEMQNNFELQKKFDNNIDIYECRDRVDDNTKIIYLAYKKVLIVAPRDFIYVRYQFQKDNEFWAVATSLPGEETYAGKTRGNILMTATRAIQKDGELHLSVYSQIDMKMPIKASAAKSRGVTEIKKYLDKCYEHLENEKGNIL